MDELRVSFNITLCEINSIKIQTISLVPKFVYFSGDSLCFIYFDIIIHQRLKKKFKLVEPFLFGLANEIKTSGLVQQLILGMLRDYSRATFSRLMDIFLKISDYFCSEKIENKASFILHRQQVVTQSKR